MPERGARATGSSERGGPLQGVTVLDLTRLVPGAFATMLLGDLGADVIKIEQPGIGDHMRWYEPRIGDESVYSWVADRNKRSLAVDLKHPDGRAVLHRLAEDADALVEGFRPGVADRLGIGYDALRAVNPGLVYCSISGHGADGPLAQTAGHDVNYVGRAGVLSVTGVGGRPAIPGVQIADLAAGSLMSTVGLLAAIVHARETGEGDHVDVAMTDGAFACLLVPLADHLAGGPVPGWEDGLLTGAFPCYGVYACADGRHVTVGAIEDRFWAALCEGVGRPDLIGTRVDPTAVPTWRGLFRTRTRAEWLHALEGRDACVGPVNDLSEAVVDPQLRHREMVIEQDHPQAGRVAQLGTPIKLRRCPGGVRTPAPALGASTRAVLAEHGYDDAEVGRLVANGAVAQAPGCGRGPSVAG